MGKLEKNQTNIAPYLAEKITGRIYFILDTHSTWIYLTSILYVQCLQISLHNDDNESNVLTHDYNLQAIM